MEACASTDTSLATKISHFFSTTQGGFYPKISVDYSLKNIQMKFELKCGSQTLPVVLKNLSNGLPQ